MAAAILNLTPDHLERHKTMTAYAHAKSRLFEACLDKEGRPARDEKRPLLVLPADCPRDLTCAVETVINSQETAGYDLVYVGKFPGAVIKGDPDCREIEIRIRGYSEIYRYICNSPGHSLSSTCSDSPPLEQGKKKPV